MAGGCRAAGGANPAPRHGRQLLVDGHSRTVRAVIGDLLRPRTRIRSRRRSHRQRRPLPRGLEPGVHAERARRGNHQGGLPDPRAAAPQEHRHRHGRRADRAGAARRAQRLRDRPAQAGHRYRGQGRRACLRRRQPRRRRAVPHHRRPQPHRRDPDR